jgi:hypothetical protein
MKITAFVHLATLAVILGASRLVAAQDVAAPSLAAFDEDVAVCRRVVRDYCAIVQDMMKAAEPKPEQQAKGLALLKEAREMWNVIQKKYAALPPAEYAADKMFKARLQDFANSLEDMEKALAGGDARRSFQACGFGCGLFVTMHEENGLDYALDKLFHLRKDIKTAQVLIKTRGLDAVRARLPAMLQKRDAVLLAPPPFPSGHEKAAAYAAAVDELSSALDRLALAVAAGDTKQVQEILSSSLTLVNKPYGLAL